MIVQKSYSSPDTRMTKFFGLFKAQWLMFNKSDFVAQKDPDAFQAMVDNYYRIAIRVPDCDLEKFFRRFNDYPSWPLPDKWKYEVTQYIREKQELAGDTGEDLSNKPTHEKWAYIHGQMLKYWRFMAYDKNTHKPIYPDAFNALGRYHIHLCQLFGYKPNEWFTSHVYNYDPEERVGHDDEALLEGFKQYLTKFRGKQEGWTKLNEIFI